MASSLKTILQFCFVIILSNLHETNAVHCYHCSYFEQTRLQDDYKLIANNRRLRLPSDHHSTCAQRRIPSDSLIVDCSTDYYNVLTKTFRDHPDPENPFENIEKKVENHIQATKNATMGCATVFVNGEWTVSGINFTVENVYRSCFPNTASFSQLLYDFQSKFPEMEITGYNCEDEDKCNGKDYYIREPHPIVSFASSKFQGHEGFYFALFFISILMVHVQICYNLL